MVIYGDLFDLGVGSFRSTFVEHPWACHDDTAKVVNFDEFSNMGRAFSDDSRHFGIVVSDGSGGMEHELELVFWGVGVVV